MYIDPTQPVSEKERQEAAIERARLRWFSRQVIEMADRGKLTRLTSMRDIAILLRSIVRTIPDLQPYMIEMIEQASNRVFKYRYTPNLLSFGDNETIMLQRVYVSTGGYVERFNSDDEVRS